MYTVLMIDDDENLLENAAEMLVLEGFNVLEASSGLEGLSIARDHLPDLVICDINMPDLDGYGVIQELRGDSLTASIPFIFLSAKTRNIDIRTGMNLGADDYLTKPFQNRDLINAVRSRLERSATLEINQLRDFSHQVVKVQEAERQNLSSSLKNNLLEMLTDLKMTLSVVDRLPEEAQQTTLQTSQVLLDHVLDEIESLSHSLYPTTLQRLGLLPTLFLLIKQFRESTSLTINFENQGIEHVTQEDLKIAIYRIIQEALENIKEHAHAQQVDIRLWIEDERLRLQIIDDGHGFDLDTALNKPQTIGLIGMRERAFLLRGELTILSSPDDGTQIYADFPLTNTDTASPPPPLTRQQAINLNLPDISHNRHRPEKHLKRVAIAEPNEITRWGLYNAIDSTQTFRVVGQVDDFSGLMNMLDDFAIDVLILSHSLKNEDNNDTLLSHIKSLYPDVAVILMSNYMEYTYANGAILQGASGYLTKTCSLDEILAALEAVVSGKQYIAADVMETIRTPDESIKVNNTLDAFSTLTEREREIFYLVINGNTNRDIAEQLVISPRTAETHRSNMMRKLNIRGTHNLVKFAVDRGLVGS